jgi:hypothetical protein
MSKNQTDNRKHSCSFTSSVSGTVQSSLASSSSRTVQSSLASSGSRTVQPSLASSGSRAVQPSLASSSSRTVQPSFIFRGLLRSIDLDIISFVLGLFASPVDDDIECGIWDCFDRSMSLQNIADETCQREGIAALDYGFFVLYDLVTINIDDEV